MANYLNSMVSVISNFNTYHSSGLRAAMSPYLEFESEASQVRYESSQKAQKWVFFERGKLLRIP